MGEAGQWMLRNADRGETMVQLGRLGRLQQNARPDKISPLLPVFSVIFIFREECSENWGVATSVPVSCWNMF